MITFGVKGQEKMGEESEGRGKKGFKNPVVHIKWFRSSFLPMCWIPRKASIRSSYILYQSDHHTSSEFTFQLK